MGKDTERKEVFNMSFFIDSITKIFRGSLRAFETFPVAIGSALAFSIVTMVRIQLDWSQQEPYNFLFNTLHWSFALGAIFSLASITFAQSRYDTKVAFKLANLLGIIVIAFTFGILYLFGAEGESLAGSRYQIISMLAEARVTAFMFISFLAFIVFAGFPREEANFSKSLFMVHKAFFIALIYGGVIMGGSSGVAQAIEALLYNDMSSKVYMYIGTIAGFVAFTIFAGYFPDFRKTVKDPHREVAQNQPRFIEILFGYIAVPILLALTVVLLLWAGKSIITGVGASFVLLSGIATAYAVFGIWLHIMVTYHETGITKFYKKFYPFAALIILGFEAWALINQIGQYGVKTTEYWFLVVWIVAVSSSLLLLSLKEKSHTIIIAISCIVAILVVQPVIGYHALPVSAQTARLESLLIDQGMLKDGKIVQSATEPDLEIREAITDSVEFLVYSRDAKLPEWLDKNLSSNDTFKNTFGFEKVWPKIDGQIGPGSEDFLETYLYLPAGPIDISQYNWAVNIQQEYEKIGNPVEIITDNGTISIVWQNSQRDGKPYLKIMLDDNVIIENDLNDYIDKISGKFPPGNQRNYSASSEDMRLRLVSENMEVLLVFRSINISLNVKEDYISYWFDLDALYIKEIY